MAEQVLVFRRELFPDLPAEGFIRNLALLPRILEVAEFMDRDRAEDDFRYKQIIPYSILRYNGHILRYKRSAWGSEERLHGQYSVGVGGHVNKSDDMPLWAGATNKSIVDWTLERELNEEFCVESPGEPQPVGLINDESNEVGRVHFGVVYEYNIRSPKVEAREKRVHIQLDLVPISSAIENAEDYENWSRIVIREYLSCSLYGVPQKLGVEHASDRH
jgi:predicted NUDIX family phosphoesterase